MKSRRILFAVSSLSAGGAERVIAELANAFAGRGHAVAVLTLVRSDADQYRLDDRVERIALDIIWESTSIWQSVIGNIRRSLMIRRAVQAFRPDIVISFIEQTNVRMLAALPASGTPVVVSERVDPRRYRIGRSWILARRILYPLAAKVVVQTEVVALWAKNIVAAGRIHVIPNFVRDLPAPPPVATRDAATMLAVGRLVPQKGFDLLLQAFARSGLPPLGVRLTVLGDGPDRPQLEALVRTLGLGDAVVMPGIVPDPETWMACSAVFVLPSRFEGFPNVLLEAMAMGCAAIAADCDSGPREIIRHGENGLLVPPEDITALADALYGLFTDAALRARLGAAALRVREQFSPRAVIARWEQLIDQTVRN